MYEYKFNFRYMCLYNFNHKYIYMYYCLLTSSVFYANFTLTLFAVEGLTEKKMKIFYTKMFEIGVSVGTLHFYNSFLGTEKIIIVKL